VKILWVEQASRLRNHGFGLGVNVVIDSVSFGKLWSEGTYGWSGYANTYFFVDPEKELVGVFMNQSLPNNPDDIWQRFTNLLYQAIVD
jgi:CubicO group peptidase (beta-lactamase class C family)